ncbi:hypothetical protein JCM10914A_02310 [Paenibacillus sp. JCM 10914]|uniref:hypothetical protein n=1 Tax=Paenibacillus sp. JCM 10914 TaxID=1236974 RepID=UPI0003CC7B5F|nr:hypothetical protein [Paenibacillus sp. JCM 10914]GAE06838.1 hypothetical protein JCM10914_3024 [Paenibacillus sp. JCM 10914]
MARKIAGIIGCALLFPLLVSCSPVDHAGQPVVDHRIEPAKVEQVKAEQEQTDDYRVKIHDVRADLPFDGNWWLVHEGVTQMTITVEAENAQTVLFWIAPTGTETRKERVLIGYDVDESDGWSYTWEFGDRIFHDHIGIEVLGMDNQTMTTATINIHSPAGES